MASFIFFWLVQCIKRKQFYLFACVLPIDSQYNFCYNKCMKKDLIEAFHNEYNPSRKNDIAIAT